MRREEIDVTSSGMIKQKVKDLISGTLSWGELLHCPQNKAQAEQDPWLVLVDPAKVNNLQDRLKKRDR